jgi:hypothetical protein
MYEVAKHFYTKFIPEIKELIEVSKHNGKAAGAEALEKELTALLDKKEHLWYTGRMPEEEQAKRKKAQEDFKNRYK